MNFKVSPNSNNKNIVLNLLIYGSNMGDLCSRNCSFQGILGFLTPFNCPNICSKDSERMFSSLGLLLAKRRLSMTGENINIQLFLRDNLVVGGIT